MSLLFPIRSLARRGVLVACCAPAALALAPHADAQPSADARPAKTARVSPPRVVHSVEAHYPHLAPAERRAARVELRVTVEADGSVGEVDVLSSAGPLFDRAAIDAVRQWTFHPAEVEGKPAASRIVVPFRFALPEVGLVEEEPEVGRATSGEERSAPAAVDRSSPPAPASTTEVEVLGTREPRAASDFVLDREVLAAAPRREGAEVLRSAPGLYVGRGEGGAVAHNYMLRGFDAEHGQDIAFSVAGIPINQPAHIHGQGYADLGFLIAPVIFDLAVTEGVYAVEQGDFAVAGSIDVSLGVSEERRGLRLQSGYGAFGTFEQLVVWAPREAGRESFGAASLRSSDGFGENRAGQGGSVILQHGFGAGGVHYRFVSIAHSARASSAGVVRRRDIDAGGPCFECVYPFATARAQNAASQRLMLGAFADYGGLEGARGQLGVWMDRAAFRGQQNFTGFTEQSRTLAAVSGRGDLIEQINESLSFGLSGDYRTAPLAPASWAEGSLRVGVRARADGIDQSQNLLDAAVRNQTWDRRVDASVLASDLGGYAEADFTLAHRVRARLGVRADLLSYAVDDRLGNFAPASRPQESFITGFRRSAQGLAWGPRLSLEYRPASQLSLLAAAGQGFRSPQARSLVDGERAPFAEVRSADLGIRWGERSGPAQLTVSGYYTWLSDDVAFDAAEGRLERVGATQRRGAVVFTRLRPAPWLLASLSATYVDAALQERPPATADDPQPPFEKGQKLAFVPPLVGRADVAAHHQLHAGSLGGLRLDAGLGYSLLSPRPLPYGARARAVSLLDASASLTRTPFSLSVGFFNLLDTEYAAVEYDFPSDWDPEDGVATRTPARHVAAGSPLSWMISLEVSL